MEKFKCDIQGCEEDAEYEDDMQNNYCTDCMLAAVENEEIKAEDFESICYSLLDKKKTK